VQQQEEDAEMQEVSAAEGHIAVCARARPVLVGKSAGRNSELKLLQLDPNALNRRSSELEVRPLSPIRNKSHQHAQKDRYAASGKIAGGLTCGRTQREYENSYATCK
jgi:hypothetical protein